MSQPSPSSPTPDVASEIFGDRLPLAEAYHDSLATVAAQRGFIGPKEVGRLWSRHVLNCAVIAEAFDEGLSVADIGSGAGLPGIRWPSPGPTSRSLSLSPCSSAPPTSARW